MTSDSLLFNQPKNFRACIIDNCIFCAIIETQHSVHLTLKILHINSWTIVLRGWGINCDHVLFAEGQGFVRYSSKLRGNIMRRKCCLCIEFR